MTPILDRIQALLKDRDAMTRAANACDLAYATGTGNPDWHTPFTADERPEHTALNPAGLIASLNGAQLIAYRNGAVTPEEIDTKIVEALQLIADASDTVRPGDQLWDVLIIANATWNAGQPLRTDKGPLGRMDRMNVFAALPIEEVHKDLHQIKAAARFVLDELSA